MGVKADRQAEEFSAFVRETGTPLHQAAMLLTGGHHLGEELRRAAAGPHRRRRRAAGCRPRPRERLRDERPDLEHLATGPGYVALVSGPTDRIESWWSDGFGTLTEDWPGITVAVSTTDAFSLGMLGPGLARLTLTDGWRGPARPRPPAPGRRRAARAR